jgi:hypothetical protein
MATNPLPLSIIADVTVVTSSPQVAAPLFNTGLIIGPSAVIPSYGVNPVIRKYLQGNWAAAMINDGFTTSQPEYIAAGMYFGQAPPPQAAYIGRQDLTAIFSAVAHSGNAGTNYAVGDIIGVIQAGASNGLLQVISVGGSGNVTGLATLIGEQGTGYAVATALTTSGGSGSGLEVDITAIGQSALQAAQVCRLKSPGWYPFMVTDAGPSDHIALSTWALSQVGTVYFGTDGEVNVLNGAANNTFIQIYNLSCKRTWMQYATTQGGLVPNQIYFVAAVMGQAMASNTQLANSAFTEKFSGGVPLLGVVTEPLTAQQILNIEGAVPGFGPNGNTFLNYANAFNVLEQGTMMAAGVFFDQILNLDTLASNIQYAIMNTLTSLPKVPQTNAGQQLLIQAVESACAQAQLIGFIAPSGIWQGQTINVGNTTIAPGTSIPGYVVLSPPYSTLTQAQIAARQAPPIYVALIEAGAVHFVVIEVLVQV